MKQFHLYSKHQWTLTLYKQDIIESIQHSATFCYLWYPEYGKWNLIEQLNLIYWYLLDLYCASAKWRVQIDRLELSLKAKLLYPVIEGLLHLKWLIWQIKCCGELLRYLHNISQWYIAICNHIETQSHLWMVLIA